jgi:hypothetical protein
MKLGVPRNLTRIMIFGNQIRTQRVRVMVVVVVVVVRSSLVLSVFPRHDRNRSF